MNIRLRYKLLSVFALLAGVFLWGRCGRKLSTAPQSATVLPKNDKEQIIIDPVKHRLTIMDPNHTQVLTLPDHPSVIDIHKDGSVQVTSPQFGFEHRVFVGLQASDTLRLGVGMDWFYFKKLDIGIGFADQVGNHIPVVFAKVSYVIYDNLQLGLTYDNRQHIGGCLTVRI